MAALRRRFGSTTPERLVQLGKLLTKPWRNLELNRREPTRLCVRGLSTFQAGAAGIAGSACIHSGIRGLIFLPLLTTILTCLTHWVGPLKYF